MYGRIARFISKRKKDIPFWIEIKKRRYTSIFNYNRLAKDMELVTIEYPYNAYYGLHKIVKKIEKIPRIKRLEYGIEHGLLAPQDLLWDVLAAHDKVYIFGNARENMLRKEYPSHQIVTHRNFMAYVRGNYSSARIRRLKKKFGKTLLIIPTHSTHHVADTFDQSVLIKETERIKRDYRYETVMVCMYWKDILLNRHLPYQKAGYKIVTAGHIYDENFLCRLKSILQLSDMIITNDTGSHIGYAIFENRPVYMYRVKSDNIALDDEVDITIYQYSEKRTRFSDRFLELFGTYLEEITDEQREFIRAHWGDF